MCPPGTDQTMRTSQKWQLESPDIRQVHLLGGNRETWTYASFIDSLFTETPTFDVWDLLAKPIIPKLVPIQAAACKAKLGGKQQGVTNAFDMFSTEILEMIVSEVELDNKDLMSLALTSTSMWNLIISRIYKSINKVAAPWINTRIVFHGNYATTLPKTFGIPPEQVAIPGRRRWGMCEARQFFWDHHGDEQPLSLEARFADMIETMRGHRENSGIQEDVWKVLEEQLRPNFFPRDQTWVLRNLTKKEFVSSDDLEGTELPIPLPRENHDDEVKTIEKALTFEDVFLVKTHWSNIVSYDMEDLGCNEGEWAGDCFDIITLDAHQLSSEDDGWKDVGESVVERMGEVRKLICEGRVRVAHFTYGR